jgi:hypothetical protein
LRCKTTHLCGNLWVQKNFDKRPNGWKKWRSVDQEGAIQALGIDKIVESSDGLEKSNEGCVIHANALQIDDVDEVIDLPTQAKTLIFGSLALKLHVVSVRQKNLQK